MSASSSFRLPFRRERDETVPSEPPFDPTSWGGALLVMSVIAAGLWVIQIANAADNYGFDRFGLRPRRIDGLWGILTQPFLHASYGHLLSNTIPLVLIGWVLLLSGVRLWLFVTALVIVLGDALTWLVAPSGLIVGASGLVFGWLGYLLARAFFSRRLKWVIVAVAVVFFFGTLLSGLLPAVSPGVSWQSHLCGFLVGVGVGAFLHPRRPSKRRPVVPVS